MRIHFVIFVIVFGCVSVDGVEIKTLEFRRGLSTKTNQVDEIPQLLCVSGDACGGKDEPEFIKCTTVGFDGANPVWKCEGYLPDGYDIGAISVTCEGSKSPDITSISIESCALRYSLIKSINIEKRKIRGVVNRIGNELDIYYKMTVLFFIGIIILYSSSLMCVFLNK